MQRFYIFLDIDGVMYDWEYIKSLSDKKSAIITKFKPESVSALNLLMQTLKTKYAIFLVITSTWRKNMGECLRMMHKNGVNLRLANVIISTDTQTLNSRSEEIENFIAQKNIVLNKNYVVIDDESMENSKLFEKSNIIKTNIFNDALSNKHITDFINNLTDNMSKDL